MAVLLDLSFAAEGTPLRHCRMSFQLPRLLAAVPAAAADEPLRCPVQVGPNSGELAVRISIGAVADVVPGQSCHEGPLLQEPRGRVLDSPEKGTQLADDLQSPQHEPVPFLQFAGPTSQDPAVLSAHRADPDHVKIAWSKLGQRLPGTDVGQDRGVGLGVDVKRSDFPTQLLEGSAHRPRSGE